MREPITILYLITSTNAGGTEKALFELIKRIDRQEFSVYVCSLKKPGAFAARLSSVADGFFTLSLSEARGVRAAVTFLPALLRLLGILRTVRPLILHCLLFRANIMGRIAGRLAGVPIIISSLRVLEAHARYKHLVDRLTAPMVDTYIAVSEAVRRSALARLALPPKKIVTIHNGIDCAAVPAPQPKEPAPIPTLLVAARFERQKGYPVFIEAVSLLVRQGTAVQAHLFGEGPDEQRVRMLVERKGLSEMIFFEGVVADIMPQLRQADVCVLPSLWEGLPNVLLEAMAAGCPIIATRIPGIDELVVDGETGILCEPGNAHSLAEALLRVIRSPQEASCMAAAARRRVESLFSINDTVCKTESLYARLVQHCRGNGRRHV